ncbi:GAF domain-containing protein [Desulfovibrio aminophilus]|uniref:GAF domain-containing protein n=1 Tax=Desulfovibrio aminophilus TaxID=81425 RepID=UPI00041EF5D9|nr:GAF domain-containing protein [Desulfovibrio aminophilus]
MDRYESYYRSLYAAAMAVNSSLDPKLVLKTIVECAAKAMDAKACSLRLLDRSGRQLMPGAGFGLSNKYLRKGPVDLDQSAVDREVLSGRVVQVADASSDPRFQYGKAAKDEGIVSVLVVPLRVEDKPVGVMRVYTDEKRTFNAEEEEFLTSIAALSALAIENARLHQALKREYESVLSFDYRTFD